MTDTFEEALRRATAGRDTITYTVDDMVRDGVLVPLGQQMPTLDGRPIGHLSRNLFEALRTAMTSGDDAPEPALAEVAQRLQLLVAGAREMAAADGGPALGIYMTDTVPEIDSAIWLEPNGPTLTAILPSDH